MSINFVSNVPLSERSGGWTAANAGLYEELCRHLPMSYFGPINPRQDWIAKIPSKVLRTFGLSGAYHFFSSRRLRQINALIPRTILKQGGTFFFGTAPWIASKPSEPYFAYTDCSFNTYIDVYHKNERFLTSDIKRIQNLEARWIAGAQRVFLSTKWAAEEMTRKYSLPDRKITVAGVGCGLQPPADDTYRGGYNLLFIAYDFERKGGPACFEALQIVERQIPSVRLVVVGGRPPENVIKHPRVNFVGVLRKTRVDEMALYRETLSSAFVLLHPTTSDIGPLTVIEAAYHGCPAISSRAFGLPELVADGETGFLLQPPIRAVEIAERILNLQKSVVAYRQMRAACRRQSIARFTWPAVGKFIVPELAEFCS